MASLFRSNNNKETLVVLLDIGSASVGGALVVLRDEALPEIVYTTRQQMVVHRQMQIERLVALMGDTFQSVLDDLSKNGVKHLTFTKRGSLRPHSAYCTFSSPWHVSQVSTMALHEDEPFLVTEHLLQELITQEVANVRQRHGLFDDLEDASNNMMLIEKKVTNLKVNGYHVSHFDEQLVTMVDMLLYTSFLPEDIMSLIEREVKNSFGLKKVHMSSYILSFFTMMRNMWHDEEDFLLIDVSGEVTEISLVKDGALFETISFPLGSNGMMRSLAHDLDTSIEEVRSLLSMHSAGTSDEATTARVEAALVAVEEMWRTSARTVLHTLSDGIFLPHRVFVTAHQPIASRVVGMLEDVNFLEKRHTESPFVPTLITSELLKNFMTLRKDVKKDPFLMLETLFAHTGSHGETS